MLALRDGRGVGQLWRLDDCTLVVTLEPCLMCAGAVLAARIPRLVIGAWDEKAGAHGPQWDVVRDARIGSRVEVIAGVRQRSPPRCSPSSSPPGAEGAVRASRGQGCRRT